MRYILNHYILKIWYWCFSRFCALFFLIKVGFVNTVKVTLCDFWDWFRKARWFLLIFFPWDVCLQFSSLRRTRVDHAEVTLKGTCGEELKCSNKSQHHQLPNVWVSEWASVTAPSLWVIPVDPWWSMDELTLPTPAQMQICEPRKPIWFLESLLHGSNNWNS